MTWYGVGLPSDLAPHCDRDLFTSWAIRAEECNFHTVAVIDKMNYDLWDPLTALAGAATITSRVRLATVVLQLPNRNAVEVAKRAAVVDQLSGGRLDLGVGLGGHHDDYAVVGAEYRGRGAAMARQIGRIREVWQEAAKATVDEGRCGPPPVQRPGPPIWIGAWSQPAVERAARIADGFVSGVGDPDQTVALAGRARDLARASGNTQFSCIAVAYVSLDELPGAGTSGGYRSIARYYGGDGEREKWVMSGSSKSVADRLAWLGAAGFDGVIALPLVPDIRFVETMAGALNLAG
jgi:alkanesulfonate monooxygenase SsuD/methylene tetrahydromethanopterin reductase-like flavin-dependent oxidoreductase (luciferase family)